MNFWKQVRICSRFSRTIVCKTSSITPLHKGYSAFSSIAQSTKFGQITPTWLRHTHTEAMTLLQYGNVVNDTLEDLADHFDILADDGFLGDDFDCSLADGVMNINLGTYAAGAKRTQMLINALVNVEHGIYVINKQTPNRQIWLSSPISGPKRYDLVDNAWVYAHEEGRTLHDLLSHELSNLLDTEVDFSQLSHAKRVT